MMTYVPSLCCVLRLAIISGFAYVDADDTPALRTPASPYTSFASPCLLWFLEFFTGCRQPLVL